MMTKLRALPPWAWVGVALVAGVGVLTWHRYARDDEDTDWTTPKETQAPLVAAFPVPGQHGTGSPMSCSAGFRTRSYPGSLTSADFSIIGEF
jgi:hypothetical protein